MNRNWIPQTKEQYLRTKEQAQNFRDAIAQHNPQNLIDIGISPKIAAAQKNAMAAFAEDLDHQASLYEFKEKHKLKIKYGYWRSIEGGLTRCTITQGKKTICESNWFMNESEATEQAIECARKQLNGPTGSE